MAKRKQPDAKMHLIFSLIKSGLRIVAGGLLVGMYYADLPTFFELLKLSGIFFIIAEGIGVVEELV